MRLNGINIEGYRNDGASAVFRFPNDADIAEVCALDGQTLRVTEDLDLDRRDQVLEVFGSYRLASVRRCFPGGVEAEFVQALEPSTEQAVEALSERLESVSELVEACALAIEDIAGGD